MPNKPITYSVLHRAIEKAARKQKIQFTVHDVFKTIREDLDLPDSVTIHSRIRSHLNSMPLEKIKVAGQYNGYKRKPNHFEKKEKAIHDLVFHKPWRTT